MAAETLPIVAAILLLGVAAQLLARRFEVPSVLFLILVGLLLGREGLGLVTLETFGGGLSTVVGLSLALNLFDGAFQLRISRLREASTPTIRLVTIGALITFVGTTLAIRFFLPVSWAFAFLVGALLVATGPTVITPILEVVPVREHVAATLEAEGIINTVTAALAAIVIYEVLVVGDGGLTTGVSTFLFRFVVGVVVGVIAAGLAWVILDAEVAPGDAPQVARFLFVSTAIGSFAGAEVVAAEAGITAAATAGVVLGNIDLPHRETMEAFGRDLTLLVLAFVFTSLAALLELEAIRTLGIAGLALVVVVVFVIRPLVVLIATVGRERFSYAERRFLAAVGPRGVIPASVATLFALELATGGDPETANLLVGTVFLVIFVTVIIQGGFARQIAELLSVIPMRTIIIGGGRVGRALATRLENRGEFVVIVETDDRQIERSRDEGHTVHAGDGTEPVVLREAGIADTKRVITATGEDDTNLLACQLASSKFGVEDVLSRVQNPDNVAAYETMDVTAIDASQAAALAIDNEIERPALTHWMNEIGEGHDVQEIEVTAENLVGRTIRDVNEVIPNGCIVAVIGRGGDTHVPSADEALEHGDHVTFIGDAEAVERARKRFHPHE